MNSTSQNTFKRQSQSNMNSRNNRNQRYGSRNSRNKFRQSFKSQPQPEEKKKFISVGPYLRRLPGSSILRFVDKGGTISDNASCGVDGRLVVGSRGWHELRSRFDNQVIYTPDETTPEWREEHLPKQLKKINDENPDEEVEMIGWEYNSKGDYFTHAAYNNKKFNYLSVRVNGQLYKLPKAEDGFKDERGLCFVITFDKTQQKWIYKQNKWTSYWDTPEGIKENENREYRLKRQFNKKRYERNKNRKPEEIMARVYLEPLIYNENH